jgi:hypothetical protein
MIGTLSATGNGLLEAFSAAGRAPVSARAAPEISAARIRHRTTAVRRIPANHTGFGTIGNLGEIDRNNRVKCGKINAEAS